MERSAAALTIIRRPPLKLRRRRRPKPAASSAKKSGGLPARFIIEDTLTGMKTLIGIIRDSRIMKIKKSFKKPSRAGKALALAMKFKQLTLLALLALAFAWGEFRVFGRRWQETQSVLKNSSMESFYARVGGAQELLVIRRTREFLMKLEGLDAKAAAGLLPTSMPEALKESMAKGLIACKGIESSQMAVWLADAEGDKTFIVECRISEGRSAWLYFTGNELSSLSI